MKHLTMKSSYHVTMMVFIFLSAGLIFSYVHIILADRVGDVSPPWDTSDGNGQADGDVSRITLSSSSDKMLSLLAPKTSSPCLAKLCEEAETQIYEINSNLRTFLSPLLYTLYFKYVKLDLNRPCPFWTNEPMCMNQQCAIASSQSGGKGDVARIGHGIAVVAAGKSSTDGILGTWRNVSLGRITFPTKQSALFSAWRDNPLDFALLDNEAFSNGVYVNLIENPERYTGYAGRSAHLVWQSIYSENCFLFKEMEDVYTLQTSVFEEPQYKCPEHSLFYKLISGLHTSISTHISYKYLNRTSGLFQPNLTSFMDKVGEYPARKTNLYFVFMVMVRALQKIAFYIGDYPINTGDEYEDQKSKDFLKKVTQLTIQCPNLFDETSLFQGPASNFLKNEFQNHFRNISRIMDCVDCQKCRLWGKIQTMGIGTALKVLFSFEDAADPYQMDYGLTKNEIVAFMNTIGKLSDSLTYIRYFEAIQDRDPCDHSPQIIFWIGTGVIIILAGAAASLVILAFSIVKLLLSRKKHKQA